MKLFTGKGDVNIDCMAVRIYILYIDYKWSLIG